MGGGRRLRRSSASWRCGRTRTRPGRDPRRGPACRGRTGRSWAPLVRNRPVEQAACHLGIVDNDVRRPVHQHGVQIRRLLPRSRVRCASRPRRVARRPGPVRGPIRVPAVPRTSPRSGSAVRSRPAAAFPVGLEQIAARRLRRERGGIDRGEQVWIVGVEDRDDRVLRRHPGSDHRARGLGHARDVRCRLIGRVVALRLTSTLSSILAKNTSPNAARAAGAPATYAATSAAASSSAAAPARGRG